MTSAIRGQSRRCEVHCGMYGTGPVHGGAVNGRNYVVNNAAYLDGSYPGQAFLSPIRAHPVLDFSQNVGDK